MSQPCFLALIDTAPQKSLGEEVNELTSSRLLKLEKDNQTLLKTVEELRGAASQDSVTKLSKVTQENQKLTQKVCNYALHFKISLWFSKKWGLIDSSESFPTFYECDSFNDSLAHHTHKWLCSSIISSSPQCFHKSTKKSSNWFKYLHHRHQNITDIISSTVLYVVVWGVSWLHKHAVLIYRWFKYSIY